PDVNFEYYNDTDNLQIYMLRISEGLYDISDEINDDLLLSYDHEGKIVAVEIYEVSKLLHASFVQGNPHFVINHIYHEDSNILRFNFVKSTPIMVNFKKTEVEDIEVGIDNAGKLVSLLFYNASSK
ncbi:7739_t:CDS:1, partial [Funneliformis mosseae]